MNSIYSAMDVALALKAFSVTDPVVQKIMTEASRVHATMNIETSMKNYTEGEHGMMNAIGC